MLIQLLARKALFHRAAQQLDGALAAPAGKEAQIPLDRGHTLAQNPLGQRDCRRIAGCVLEDIVVILEVRNAGPLERNLVVQHHIVSIVQRIELPIFFAENLRRERHAAAA